MADLFAWFNGNITPVINLIVSVLGFWAMLVTAVMTILLAVQERHNPLADKQLRDTPATWAYAGVSLFCLWGPARYAYYYFGLLTDWHFYAVEKPAPFLRLSFPFVMFWLVITAGAIAVAQTNDYRHIDRILKSLHGGDGD